MNITFNLRHLQLKKHFVKLLSLSFIVMLFSIDAFAACPSATITYSGSPFCTSLASKAVSRTGTAGGVYSSTAGLSINSSTGAIAPASSTPGNYIVTYTIAAAGSCAQFTTTASVTITAMPTAIISYSSAPFCNSLSTPQSVTLTGTSGGVFSSAAGLTLDPSTGDITPSTSTSGTYTVTYTIAASGGCAMVKATTSVKVTTAPTATISYAGTPFCTSLTSKSVTRTGTAGGVYTSTPGLTINSSTGAIAPSTSTAGDYTVTYTIAASGGCAQITATAPVTITTLPTAVISYSTAPFCNSLSTPQSVTFTGTSGGIFSAAAGLSLDGTTGDITPSTSTVGTYTVSYTIAASGGCATVKATTSVKIGSEPNPSTTISYVGSPFCTSLASKGVTRSGTSGGVYTSTPGLTINSSTGAIAPASSAAGDYIVTYTIAAANGCSQFVTTAPVTITTMPTASIVYSGAPYCNQQSTPQSVTLTGTSGGVFTTKAGLSLDATTGDIVPSTSTIGTYAVTYTIAAAGGCAQVKSTDSVAILPNNATATISYTLSPYCTSVTTYKPVKLVGTTGGVYSSTPGLILNSSTGAILPSASTPGTYTVTYTVPSTNGCGGVTTTTSVTITALPTASISYPGTPYCTSLSAPQAVSFTGTSGGTFSSTTGLTLSATTGDITPSTSTGDTYVVTYTIAAAGGCEEVTANASLDIVPAPVVGTLSATDSVISVCGGVSSIDLNISNFTGTLDWQSYDTNTSSWVTIPSTTDLSTYTVAPSVTTQYRAIVTSAAGCADVVSSAITIYSYGGTPSVRVTASTPYAEDFSASPSCWTINSVSGSATWSYATQLNTFSGSTPKTVLPVSGSYLAAFNGGAGTAGSVAELISPVLDISSSSMTKPVFTFAWLGGKNGTLDKLNVYVSSDNGSTWGSPVAVKTPDFSWYTTQWQFASLDLSAHIGGSVRIKFEAVSDGGNPIAIDDLNLINTVCTNPSGLSNTATSYYSNTFQWNAMGDSAQVRYRKTGTTVWISSPYVTTNSWTWDKLIPNTTFDWEVDVWCGGASLTSASTVTTLSNSPAVSGMTVTAVSAGKATFSWNTVPGAVKYSIAVSPDNGTTWEQQTIVSTTTRTILLSSGTTYAWRVITLYGYLYQEQVDVTYGPGFTTSSCAATNLKDSLLSATSVKLSWTAISGATKYWIRLSSDGGSTWTTPVSVTNASYTRFGLTAGTSYEWQVAGTCDGAIRNYVSGPNFTTPASRLGNFADEEQLVTVYPNPFENDIQVSLGSISEGTSIKIFDSMGKEILTSPLTDVVSTISTAGLSKGMYVVYIFKQNEAIYTTKLIKQ